MKRLRGRYASVNQSKTQAWFGRSSAKYYPWMTKVHRIHIAQLLSSKNSYARNGVQTYYFATSSGLDTSQGQKMPSLSSYKRKWSFNTLLLFKSKQNTSYLFISKVWFVTINYNIMQSNVLKNYYLKI